MSLINYIKKEFVNGRNLFEVLFVLFGILTQVITYVVTGDTFLSFISGIFGVFAVVLTSQRKISSYIFSFAQLLTYVVLLFQQNLYAAIFENVFYFVTLVFGVFIWLKHYGEENEENKVETKHLTKEGWWYCIWLTILGTFIIWAILARTDDTQPFMDAITTAPALVAEVLMICRYREQWYFWGLVDVLCIVLWCRTDNWCMVAQYIFWTANCVYGYFKWK